MGFAETFMIAFENVIKAKSTAAMVLQLLYLLHLL
jgi:hypothetical protein